MLPKLPAIVTLAAATVLSAAVVPGEVLARPAGGHAGHAGSFHRGHAGHAGSFHRGYVGHHAGAYHGYHGGFVRHGGVGVYHGGPYRIGHRYHGGTWYGTGPHWWRGRWYSYGVGPCWLWSPIGYVWVCG